MLGRLSNLENQSENDSKSGNIIDYPFIESNLMTDKQSQALVDYAVNPDDTLTQIAFYHGMRYLLQK